MASLHLMTHIIGHHTWNYLLAWRDFVQTGLPPNYAPHWSHLAKSAQTSWLSGIRCLSVQRLLSFEQGGVFKLFQDNQLVASWLILTASIGRRSDQECGWPFDRCPIRVDINDMIYQRGQLGWAEAETDDSFYSSCAWWCSPLGVSWFWVLQKCWLQAKGCLFAFSGTYGAEWALVYYRGVVAQSWKHVLCWYCVTRLRIYVVIGALFQRGQLQPWRPGLIDQAPRSGAIATWSAIFWVILPPNFLMKRSFPIGQLIILSIICSSDFPKLVKYFKLAGGDHSRMVVPLTMLTAVAAAMPSGRRIQLWGLLRQIASSLVASVLNMVLANPENGGYCQKLILWKSEDTWVVLYSLSLRLVLEKSLMYLSLLLWCLFELILYPTWGLAFFGLELPVWYLDSFWGLLLGSRSFASCSLQLSKQAHLKSAPS